MIRLVGYPDRERQKYGRNNETAAYLIIWCERPYWGMT